MYEEALCIPDFEKKLESICPRSSRSSRLRRTNSLSRSSLKKLTRRKEKEKKSSKQVIAPPPSAILPLPLPDAPVPKTRSSSQSSVGVVDQIELGGAATPEPLPSTSDSTSADESPDDDKKKSRSRVLADALYPMRAAIKAAASSSPMVNRMGRSRSFNMRSMPLNRSPEGTENEGAENECPDTPSVSTSEVAQERTPSLPTESEELISERYSALTFDVDDTEDEAEASIAFALAGDSSVDSDNFPAFIDEPSHSEPLRLSKCPPLDLSLDLLRGDSMDVLAYLDEDDDDDVS